MDANPLLSPNPIPPMDQVRAEHVGPAFEILLERTHDRLNAIRSVTEPTFANSVEALENSTTELGNAYGIVSFLTSVNHSDELQAAFEEVTPAVVTLFSGISLDPAIWKVLRAFGDTPEAAALTGVSKRLLTRTMDEFRRNGADLDDASRTRLSDLRTELAEVTNRFASNVLQSGNAWHHDLPDDSSLGGVPETIKGMCRAAAEAAGVEGYRLLLQAPIYRGILIYGEDRDLRERMWRAWNTRATRGEFDNRPLLDKVLSLRHELATLLGYDTFADYVLADRMAVDGATALQFVNGLREEGQPLFQRELEMLKARHAEHSDADFAAWDASKLSEDIRKERFDFDHEQLRPWFALDRVLKGAFELAERLFGVVVRPTELPVWHEDVTSWELVEGERVLGRFFVDMYPRATKRGGAWMSPLRHGAPTKDGLAPHLGAICGNLTPPTDGKPSLLTHTEVETIFHEFGHLLHHLLTEVPYASLAGTSVAWDFVELPSQVLQNWCWERESLDTFAVHWETGETIPEDIFQALVAARTHGGGRRLMMQLGYASVDLGLHAASKPVDNVLDFARDTYDTYTAGDITEDFAMVASFSHLFASPTGYAAGYYSYQWAEVLDADAFTRFENEGIFNPEVGQAFRDEVLARGNGEEPGVLFEAFMGRPANPGAHLRRYGL